MKKDIICCFRISRGGRFFNPGHLEYLPHIQHVRDLPLVDYIYPPEDNDPHAEWVGEDGTKVGLTNNDYNTGVGIINSDGNYDTEYCKYIVNLSNEELEVVFKSKYVSSDVLYQIFEGVSTKIVDAAKSYGLLWDLYEHIFQFCGEENTFLEINQVEI